MAIPSNISNCTCPGPACSAANNKAKERSKHAEPSSSSDSAPAEAQSPPARVPTVKQLHLRDLPPPPISVLREEELFAVVDVFIVVEAKQSHQGVPKPLYFDENKGTVFKRFLDKIEHVVIEKFPFECVQRCNCENYQRNAMMEGVRQLQSPAHGTGDWLEPIPGKEEENDIKTIVEFGSGQSTRFFHDLREENKLDYTLYSFDHNKEYSYSQTHEI